MVRAIVGANWGDEGKGKMTDHYAAQAEYVVRFQGGSNAGHTIINEYGKFALHILPSGIFHPDVVNVIANGAALNISDLRAEMESIEVRGVLANIRVSDRAQVLLPFHVLLDTYEEQRLAENQFGSTGSGIAPFYADKYAKTGLQVWQLYEDPTLEEKVEDICLKKNVLFQHLYHRPLLDSKELLSYLREAAEWLRPYVTDTAALLRDVCDQGKTILLEGQLGTLRDIDLGIYPYTTSSSTLAGYAATGAGISPTDIDEIVAVTKAYSSCVGEGPFVTELFDAEAEELRSRGGDAGEYGAKTGRPRRVGWFDAVATRYGCRMQGATDVALTNLDVLGYLKEIPICVGYQIDGAQTRDFPTNGKLFRAKPIYETMPGWGTDLRGETDYQKLPKQAKDYITRLEELVGIRFRYLSTGPEREALIDRR